MSMLAGVHVWFDLPTRPICQNFAHLRRPLDLARVARHPGRRHRLLRDAVEMLRADFDLAQAARHAEAANEAVEHVAGVLVRMAHGGGDQRLALGIGRLVPAHHRRQHHAGGVAVRHAEFGAEHVADAVAGAHRHAGGQRPGRKPGPDLAIHPRVEVRRRRPSPAAAPAPASTVPSAPARRRRDAPRASRCPRRNDRRRGCRSTGTAIPACAC